MTKKKRKTTGSKVATVAGVRTDITVEEAPVIGHTADGTEVRGYVAQRTERTVGTGLAVSIFTPGATTLSKRVALRRGTR